MTTSSDRQIREVVQQLVAAWNAGEGDAFAVLFTPLAVFVTSTGERIVGRAAIARLAAAGREPAAVARVSIAMTHPQAVARFVWRSGERSRQAAATMSFANGEWRISDLRMTE